LNAGPADNAANYNVVVSNTTGNSCKSTSTNASLTVTPLLTLAAGTASGTSSISAANTGINDASCNVIAKVVPAGGVPVNGNVTATVTIAAGLPSYNGQPYLARHFDISPATNASNVTASITLYFLQSEFDTYNMDRPGTTGDLPTGPSDLAGIQNLRVTQYHGTGSAPGAYTGFTGAGPAIVLIDPEDANITWNSTRNWWEVTFDVTGFSGFYITGFTNFVLPIELESFTGNAQGNNVLLNWVIGQQIHVAYYEIEESVDGMHFSVIKNITATNKRNYSFLHNPSAKGLHYYRLKVIDVDGRLSYSNVLVIDLTNTLRLLQVSPNPFRDRLQVHLDVTKQAITTFMVTDLGGKIMLKQHSLLAPGANSVIINQVNRLAKGTYILYIRNNEINKTLKIIKVD
jgi:hypothetical protein